MKCYTVFTIFFLASLGAAAPVDNGKVPAVSNSKAPSQQGVPPTKPLPGRTGIHTNDATRITTLYYGDDNLPEHMGHLQRNQAQYPHNRRPMSLAPNARENRKAALQLIQVGGKHPVSGFSRARDEKMPAMLNNLQHSTSTTVEYLPEYESRKEGGYTSAFKQTIQKGGPGAQGQLRPNPGWLPLHPGQQRGHEAPARLNSQKFRPGPSGDKKQVVSPPSRASTPSPPPSPPLPPSNSERAPAGPSRQSNLQPGRVVPAGHVWKPTVEKNTPSHVNAPAHLPGAEKRYPPRPQNHAHYAQQLMDKKAAEKQKQTGSQARPTTNDPKHAANLARFEKKFGPGKKGNGAGRANEAPPRVQANINNVQARPAPRPARAPQLGPKGVGKAR
ncbi:hypothetical protein BDZ94DRAFT_1321495 [Collybia nuda]|uniref:Uncharacterized protein n=1 Tax=Collybia nuda TaxID=64659 RepID=A0A9P5Y5I9_9AGAR|nr:hypothetical protein BDZ94DRAFT_1321495 [Collybia nuda]